MYAAYLVEFCEHRLPAVCLSVCLCRAELGDGRRSRMQRSLFPLSSAAENRGKVHSQADLERLMAAGDTSDPGGDGWNHIGLFADDAALRNMVDWESE